MFVGYEMVIANSHPTHAHGTIVKNRNTLESLGENDKAVEDYVSIKGIHSQVPIDTLDRSSINL